jgi:hypothetical protein
MRPVVLAAFVLLSIECLSQEEIWFCGVVVTAGEEVLQGELLFHPKNDMLVIRQQDQVKVLTSDLVKSFRYFDESANINRKFVSLTAEGMDHPGIYELIIPGDISVLRKMKRSAGPSPSDQGGYRYFFYEHGKLQPIEKFTRRLYPSIRMWLIKEEKEFHLNRNRMADAIRYIQLYNQKFSLLALH